MGTPDPGSRGGLLQRGNNAWGGCLQLCLGLSAQQSLQAAETCKGASRHVQAPRLPSQCNWPAHAWHQRPSLTSAFGDTKGLVPGVREQVLGGVGIFHPSFQEALCSMWHKLT